MSNDCECPRCGSFCTCKIVEGDPDTYKPRNDVVWLKKVDRGSFGSLKMPGQASQGKELHVVAVGLKVADLKPGDKVVCIGDKGIHFMEHPEHPNYFLARESIVMEVVGRVEK